jgi:hypothetical protein
MVIATLAKVPSGISSPAGGICGWASLRSYIGGLLLAGGQAVAVARGGRRPALILASSGAEVGRLGHVEAAGAVLGRQAEGIAGAADEAALGGLLVEHVAALGVAARRGCIEITWSTMPGSSRPALPPSICGCQVVG